MAKNTESPQEQQGPAIILCRPQMGENIGATARAMLNLNLTDLRIIAPRDSWPNERANATASGALELMPPVKIYDTLQKAIKDLHFCLATTARQRDMVKPVYEPDTGIRKLQQYDKTGIIFGAERTGLTNEEISLCQAILTFPTNPDFSSLNLSQSVLLTAYEWSKISHRNKKTKNRTKNKSAHRTPEKHNAPAPQSEITAFIERLEQDLEARRFFRTPEMKPTMMVNIRNIFTRTDITDQEVRTLHGILSALRGNKTSHE
ncbi:MAG: RNA methyltransferase [Alphaproteobacteria bacterium]